jgi:hydrogenase small subunit
MECGACSGESMAILGAEGPGIGGDNLADFLESSQLQLLWHPSLSLESPKEVEGLIERILAGEQELTLLCVEGSIIHGPDGTGMFDTFCGSRKGHHRGGSATRRITYWPWGPARLRGIPAAPPNPTESSGLQFRNDRPGGLLSPEWRSRRIPRPESGRMSGGCGHDDQDHGMDPQRKYLWSWMRTIDLPP